MNIIECEMKKIPTINIPSSSDKAFTFLLLNTRSFSKHTIDISIDKRLYQADVYFLSDRNSSLREKFTNTELFLVRIFLHSIQIQENTDQK